MDTAKEGILLIISTAIILVAFLLTVFAVMIIYRKRKIEHNREISDMNERFSQELLQAQIDMQQQTMQQIGQEIHDNVGQKLTLAELYIRQLETDTGPADKRLDSVASLINESLSDLRSLSKNLTDTNYWNAGLYELIDNECNRIRAASSCAIRLLSAQKQIKVSSAVKKIILRILQEFLQNSLKHAGCSEIEIQLNEEERGLSLKAADNGKGFDPDQVDKVRKGIGLENMRKRAELIGAAFELKSSSGNGTLMRLFIPVEKLNL